MLRRIRKIYVSVFCSLRKLVRPAKNSMPSPIGKPIGIPSTRNNVRIIIAGLKRYPRRQDKEIEREDYGRH
jgi:hypothetical protein